MNEKNQVSTSACVSHQKTRPSPSKKLNHSRYGSVIVSIPQIHQSSNVAVFITPPMLKKVHVWLLRTCLSRNHRSLQAELSDVNAFTPCCVFVSTNFSFRNQDQGQGQAAGAASASASTDGGGSQKKNKIRATEWTTEKRSTIRREDLWVGQLSHRFVLVVLLCLPFGSRVVTHLTVVFALCCQC